MSDCEEIGGREKGEEEEKEEAMEEEKEVKDDGSNGLWKLNMHSN